MPKLKIKPEHRVIDLEFAKAGIRYFFSTNSSRAIRFFAAGEPTQAFPDMVEIFEYAKWLAGPELKVELQTNGCFSEEVANWVERNVDVLWISCDGPPEIQDRQRPMVGGKPSSPIVLQNVQRYAKVNRMQFGVRATVAEENLSRQTELVEFFQRMGVKFLCAAPTYHSTVNQKIKTPPLLVFAENFVPAFYQAKKLGMFYQTHLIVNFDEPVEYYCRACTPCPQLTSDGFISCCDWACFGPDYLPGPLQELLYGHYDKETKKIIINEEKKRRIMERNVNYLALKGCSGCPALTHCAGGCIGKMIVETNDLYKATSEWCTAVKHLMNNLPLNQGLFPCLHS